MFIVRVLQILSIGALLISFSGCGMATRISEIGSGPKVSDIDNPVAEKNYKPVTMPMPKPRSVVRQANSLWNQDSDSFFDDQRAKAVGDVVTVNVKIDDSANFQNSTDASRSGTRSGGVSNVLGLGKAVKKLLPEGADLGNLYDSSNGREQQGSGSISRKETLNLKVAAIITQILPNGNFVVVGHQEARVNSELRQLSLKGVVRPQDIDIDNSIDHDKIAELRVSYNGRGVLTDVQTPSYGTQFFDIVSPF